MNRTVDRPAAAVVLPRLAVGLAAIAVVAALAATWAGVVLADIYRPHAPAIGPWEVTPDWRRSRSWSDWHGRAALVLLGTTVGTAALAGWLRYGPARLWVGRPTAVLWGSIVAVLAALVTGVSRGMVQWDQLALRVVRTDLDLSGYWSAAFDDGIRFVLVDASEISQSQYALALLVHLAAPAVAGTASAAAAFGLLPALRTPPTIAEAEMWARRNWAHLPSGL